MLNYLVLKPESMHILHILKDSFLESTENNKELAPYGNIISQAITDYNGGKLSDQAQLTEGYNFIDARLQILDPNIVDTLYPQRPKNDNETRFRNALDGQPILILFFDLHISICGRSPYEIFAEIKGKFITPNYPEGTRTRGILRRRYSELTLSQDVNASRLENGANFLHSPDSENEAQMLYQKLYGTDYNESKEGNSMIKKH